MNAFTIVTHSGMPAGSADDIVLKSALEDRGAAVRTAVWDDPRVNWSTTAVTVIRSTWDYHLKPSAWKAWLARASASTSIVNDPTLVGWNTEKTYLLVLEALGVPIIPTELPDTREELVNVCAARGWTDFVIKPVVGASSAGTRRYGENSEDAAGHFEALRNQGRVMVQPYQPTIEVQRERSLVYIDGGFSHAFSKPAFYAAHRGDAFRAHEPSQDELTIADKVLASLPSQPTVARIDMLPAASGPLVMEVELIEPALALHLYPKCARRLANALIGRAHAAGQR